ncbi:MAG: hypothetical protein KKH02_11170 [Proteobacteria bacterium]|nr:hypothetical protein [Pseudomonadota bacterium]
MIALEIFGMQKDLEAFGRLLPERQERIAKASAEPVRDDPMNELARRLHPERIDRVRGQRKMHTDGRCYRDYTFFFEK